MCGRTGYLAGLVAEDSVARHYAHKGGRILARRWRGAGGEIDVIVEHMGVVVFVEAKKSRSFARAALRVGLDKIRRLHIAAQEYLGTLSDGGLRDARFDVALLNAGGQIEVVENVLFPSA